MIILISALFMVFFIAGFIASLITIAFFQKYINKNTKIEEVEKPKPVTNDAGNIMAEWLYGESRGEINE